MGRSRRTDIGGHVYHVLNRANARQPLLASGDDRDRFIATLREVRAATGMRICAFCVMPNHWHLVIWPQRDGEVAAFVGRLTLTHTQRHHARHRSAGHGHLYQGRYKSFLVQDDEHFLTVCRYVERNPVRAELVAAAAEWPWGSAGRRRIDRRDPLLGDWPLPRPRGWSRFVDREPAETLGRLRESVARGRPFGDADWVSATCDRFALHGTLRPRGRPKAEAEGAAEDDGSDGAKKGS